MATTLHREVGHENGGPPVDPRPHSPTEGYVPQIPVKQKNGWKNSGAPWTYDCVPDLLWIEETK